MTFDPGLSSAIYIFPFLGILLSISLGPILFSNIWHANYFRFSLFWLGLSIIMMTAKFGVGVTYHEWMHMFLHEYVPFILMIVSLYTVTGGIHIVLKMRAKARTNTAFLLFGGFLASFIGTTGASMLLIRPYIEMNRHRKYKTHLMVFFIFIIANIGGSLTPLGDPPLFLGYLQGIPFWWPMEHLFFPMIKMLSILLAIFWIMDRWLFIKDAPQPKARTKGEGRFHITGFRNFPILIGIVLTVWLMGAWTNAPQSGVFDLTWSELGRDLLLLGFAVLSWKITPGTIRRYNSYSWEPFKEVAKIFIGIFTTIIPVIQMLNQGENGLFAGVLRLANPGGVPDDILYFWLTGWLSAFLDNAPTYLVFFHMAGGNPEVLSTTMSSTLMAISAGAVFMGAMTYIGNAPNFMVKAIAEKQNIKMPSFFGFLGWSCVFLLPCLVLFSWFFLHG